MVDEHMGDAGEVQSARRHIGGDEQRDFPGAEFVCDDGADLLGEACMEEVHPLEFFCEVAADPFDLAARAAEDDRLLGLKLLDQIGQMGSFVLVMAVEEAVVDGSRAGLFANQ